MEDQTLPTEYDAIILGTGMGECILAAALSRIGQKVLHLDRNDYYSGDWATFNFKALREWIDISKKEPLKPCEIIDVSAILKEGEKLLPLNINSETVANVSETIYVQLTTATKDLMPGELSTSALAEDNFTKCTLSEHKVLTEVKPTTKSESDIASTDPHMVSVQGDVSVPEETEDGKEEVTDSTTSEEQCTTSEDQCTTSEDQCTQAATVTASQGSDKQAISNKTENTSNDWTLEKIEHMWRKFNIDIMPKILFGRGPMVELLISSDIAKYCEFRAVTRILTYINDQIQTVPCSRADVFSSKQVNMIEKRILMKLLTFCADYANHPEEYAGFEDKPYIEFLKSKKLSGNVLHYVLRSIAMATETTTTVEGLKKTQKFIQSLGRYGNTAFLWPMYGSGEIPQCFCRVCAVFGGVYCLRRTAQSMIVNSDNVFQGIVDTTGQKLSAKWLFMESSYASSVLQAVRPSRRISRAILLTSKSILPDSQKHITLMSMPPCDGGSNPVTVYELSSLSMACPEGLFVIQLICGTTVDAESDLGSTIDKLFDRSVKDTGPADDVSSDSDKPRVLWSVFFTVIDSSQLQPSNDLPDNVHIVSGPTSELDMDTAILQARSLFEKLCPDEEFLPKAPNPEDIIFEGMESGSGFAADDSGDKTGPDSSTEPQASSENPETIESNQDTEKPENCGSNDPQPKSSISQDVGTETVPNIKSSESSPQSETL